MTRKRIIKYVHFSIVVEKMEYLILGYISNNESDLIRFIFLVIDTSSIQNVAKNYTPIRRFKE